SAKSIQRSPGKLQPNHGKRSWGRSAKKTNVKPVAASPIQQLQQIFSRGSPYKSASQEMQSMIQAGDDDAERFSQLVDVLLDSELPFKEASLGNGEWQVVYTRGALLWQQLTSPGQVKSTGRLSYKSKRKVLGVMHIKCIAYSAGILFTQFFMLVCAFLMSVRHAQAGQAFNPLDRSVLNKGELLGSQVTVTAQGTYEPQDSNTTLPKLVKANISGGQITAWGRQIPLPISGTGFFSVMYVDDNIRVFSDQKKGTVSVQMQASKLGQLTA
ncbi:MAG: hypothetical protein FRX49_05327, partial [Trebouxia sp. A1-2]